MPDILPLLLSLQAVLPKTVCGQLVRIVMAMLVMPGNITQLGIARWTEQGGSYRTVHRFFHTDINWLEVTCLFFQRFVHHKADTHLLIGDETVLKKAGRHTHGLDWFFSSLAQKAVPGVAFFGLALVNVRKRQAYTLCAEQVVRTEAEKEQAQKNKQAQQAKKQAKTKTDAPKKSPGRPQGSKNKNKADIVLSAELQRIQGWAKQVLSALAGKVVLRYFVLDGHFGTHPAYQMVRQLDLHLVSKLQHNAALFLLPTASELATRPRLKYGAKLDYDALPLKDRVSSKEERGYRQEIYQMACRHKDFADVLNVVILVKTNLETNRRAHVVLFSSDVTLGALTLIDYYTLRFQIEFEFRDAKQHWGLSDFVCVNQTAVANSVGLAFFVGNLSAHLLEGLREQFPDAGVWDLKSYYRGRRYVQETLKCLPEWADAIVCERVMEQVCRLGLIHSGPQGSPKAPSGGPIGFSAGGCALEAAA